MFLLDTNVLVYAVGREHPLRAPARTLLEAAAAGRLSITTTPEVIHEFLHVYAVARERGEASAMARDFARACSPLLSSGELDVAVAVELFRRHTRIDAFGALLAAVAFREPVSGLVSADRAFADVAGLLWNDLSDLDVEGLARSQRRRQCGHEVSELDGLLGSRAVE